MAFISVSFSFSANSTIVSSQVNQNFQDLINGLKDGTKNLSINDITVAGTITGGGTAVLSNGANVISPITSDTTIELADNTTGAGKQFTIQSQDAFATSGANGGKLLLIAGKADGAGVGGGVTINAGQALSGTKGNINIGGENTKTTIITADNEVRLGVTGGVTTTISQTGSTCNIQSTDLTLGNSAGGALLCFYGGTTRAQASAITKPSGGGTVDAEARTAIDLLIDLVGASSGVGLTA